MLNTRTNFLRPLLFALVMPLAGACDTAPTLDDEFEDDLDLLESSDDDEDDLEFRVGGLTTGRRLNTNNSGGHFFDELPLAGQTHEGVDLLGIEYFPGGVGQGPAETIDISTIDIIGHEFHALTTQGTWVHHGNVGSTRWHIATPTGEYDLTVESGFHQDSQTLMYHFAWTNHGSAEQPEFTCVMEGEEYETAAVLTRGIDVHPDGTITSDDDILHIGCIAGATGKAVIWEYDPELLPIDIFEASIRMLRADYCGDGTSWTQPGTPILVEDNLGINNDITNAQFPLGLAYESAWDSSGALCVDVPRIHGTFWVQPSCNGYPMPLCGSGPQPLWNSPSAIFYTATL